MLSIAAFEQGRHAQAFPSFGSERTGAPVVAFCRIDHHEIRPAQADPIARRIDHPGPDAAASGRGFPGLRDEGYELINIEGWYNPRRRHSALGHTSPSAFEARNSQKMHRHAQRIEHGVLTVGVCVAGATPARCPGLPARPQTKPRRAVHALRHQSGKPALATPSRILSRSAST
jgi:hypothetical protein